MVIWLISGELVIQYIPKRSTSLIIIILGMIFNSSVVVQGMTIKLRPCLHFRAVSDRKPLQEKRCE